MIIYLIKGINTFHLFYLITNCHLEKKSMQKTQVLKLNTSKNNLEVFFNKMKDKFVSQKNKDTNPNNDDITMIAKHQNKGSLKGNVNNPANNKIQTLESILSENDPDVKSTNPQNNNQIEKIFDEDMNVIGIIRNQQSIRKEKRQHEICQSQKMNTVRNFVSSTNNYFSNSPNNQYQKHPEVKQQSNQKSIESSQESESESSYLSQFQEQELKKNISHQHIDIFPNIQINAAVTQRLNSMKSMNRPQAKKNKTVQRRRCSIDNENLLSPRMQNLVREQIKHQSTKEIDELLKNRLKSFNSKEENYFSVSDCIKEAKESEEEPEESRQKVKRNRTSIRTQQVQIQQKVNFKEKVNLSRPLVRSKTRDRNCAMAKRSIFSISSAADVSKASKASKHKIQFVDQKSQKEQESEDPRKNIQLQQPTQMNNANASESQLEDTNSSSSNQQPEDSIYVIENKLNDCIHLLEKNQLSSLEDFLYEFKNKYFHLSNTKMEIKWRLLMAHCKEKKKEFQRAAVNYNSVIHLAKQNPKSLTIDPAEVYHRLGVCYSQIGQWNKGILVFTEALNRYKRSNNVTKYAECMNNLGTLYLQAESINLAEKCFILSYDLKKSLYGKNNTKLLTSLFNIFECNLLTKNYDQAQKVIQLIEQQIINRIPQTQLNKLLYLGGLYRRIGKMHFLRGNIQSAEENYLKAFGKLRHKYPYCMQFGELMSCLGILKLDDNKYKEAKQYYDKAIMLMNFYCPKDSKTIHILKKNLEYAVKMIKEEKQGTSRRSVFE